MDILKSIRNRINTFKIPFSYLWRKENNDDIIQVSNVASWQNAGFTGKGVKILIAELKTDSLHDKMVKTYARFALDASVLSFSSSGNYKAMLKFALENDVDIVNTSFTMKIHDYLEKDILDLLKQCIDKGIIFVNSIGNTGSSQGIGDNAYLHPKVINVGAVDKDLKRESYSSYDSDWLDCMGVVGFFNPDNAGMSYVTGTSGGAPWVSFLSCIFIQWYKEKYGCRPDADYMVDSCTVDINEVGYDVTTGKGVFVLPSLKNGLAFRMYSGVKKLFGSRKHAVPSLKKGRKLYK